MKAILSRFKVYRWWKGGMWAFYEGQWLRADFMGFHQMEAVDSQGRPTIAWFHHSFNGVEKRENYTGCKISWL
jgi:hypothetical protein